MPSRSSFALQAAAFLALIPIFIADWFTPLGLSVWILYLIPLGLTLRGSSPQSPLALAGVVTVLLLVTTYTDERVVAAYIGYWNRGIGLVVIWSVAGLSRWLLITRTAMMEESRLRGVQGELLRATQGDLSPREIGTRVLGVLVPATGAVAGAFYASDDEQRFTLSAVQGVDVASLPAEVHRGDGLIGEALDTGALRVVDDVPAARFRMSTSLTSGPPRHLLLVPLIVEDERLGVVELALETPPDHFVRELLDRVSGSTAKSPPTRNSRRRPRRWNCRPRRSPTQPLAPSRRASTSRSSSPTCRTSCARRSTACSSSRGCSPTTAAAA